MRRSVTSGGNPMSEAEMDLHTIRGLREEAAAEGRAMKQLVALRPEDSLALALKRLFRNRCSMAPVLTGPSTGCALPVCLPATARALRGPALVSQQRLVDTPEWWLHCLECSLCGDPQAPCCPATTCYAVQAQSTALVGLRRATWLTRGAQQRALVVPCRGPEPCRDPRTGRRQESATPPGTPPLHSPKSRAPSDEPCALLHIATISGVLAALMRYFRPAPPGMHGTRKL